MINRFYSSIIILFSLCIYSKNLIAAPGTWVTATAYIQGSAVIPPDDSTTVGPIEIVKLPNGNIISIIQSHADGRQFVVSLDTNGVVLWENYSAYHASGFYIESCS